MGFLQDAQKAVGYPTNWVRELRNIEYMLSDPEAPIYGVRMYDSTGKLKKEIPVSQLVSREKKKGGKFNAPL